MHLLTVKKMSQRPDAAWLENLVGQELVKKSGAVGVSPLTQVSTSELRGKHILLYFSATWCTPCKKFTPQLVDFYTKTKERLNLEIIFISLDRDAKVHAVRTPCTLRITHKCIACMFGLSRGDLLGMDTHTLQTCCVSEAVLVCRNTFQRCPGWHKLTCQSVRKWPQACM